MTTKKKSEALRYLESLTGGPLTFSETLKTLRECEEESQSQFATRLGISRQHLCDIEKGRKGVTAGRAAGFALKLGYPPEFFVELALRDELKQAGIKLKLAVRKIA